MDKLKEEILKLTMDSKMLTEKQFFKLLIHCRVRFNTENYDEIDKFLNENGITLTSKDENDKKYVLVK